jgi:hypothetical protein
MISALPPSRRASGQDAFCQDEQDLSHFCGEEITCSSARPCSARRRANLPGGDPRGRKVSYFRGSGFNANDDFHVPFTRFGS